MKPLKKPKGALTFKQKKFVENYVLGEDPGNAADAAYNSYAVKDKVIAARIGCQLLKQNHIQREIEKLMEKHEITPDYLMGKLKEGLEAKVVSNYQGDVEETEVPNLDVRHKWFQEAAKISGIYAPEKTENLNMNIDKQLDGMSEEEFAKLLKEMYSNVIRKHIPNVSGNEKIPQTDGSGN